MSNNLKNNPNRKCFVIFHGFNTFNSEGTFVEETRNLLRGASKETLARDTEESDREYIKTRQERNKIAQQMIRKIIKI